MSGPRGWQTRRRVRPRQRIAHPPPGRSRGGGPDPAGPVGGAVHAGAAPLATRARLVGGVAVRRTRSHLLRLNKIYEDVKSEKIDSGWLEKVEEIDNIFPNIDYRVYRPL